MLMISRLIRFACLFIGILIIIIIIIMLWEASLMELFYMNKSHKNILVVSHFIKLYFETVLLFK